ncbi:MAG: ATP-binding cassette domain-containing protein [Anaerolineae bacterium]|nr:ATP-binding cassette domain-containing protein [Anaerolineae bacterium]
MDDPIIQVRHLQKTFRRRGKPTVKAVRNLTLDVGRGQIFGLVGPDGAGKTTTIQMLCGILIPSGGSALVAGVDVVHNADATGGLIGGSVAKNLACKQRRAEALACGCGLAR